MNGLWNQRINEYHEALYLGDNEEAARLFQRAHRPPNLLEWFRYWLGSPARVDTPPKNEDR